ncbi:MAG: 2-oxoacid:acceptor oxidoreductase family protein, partial [Microgenomates group bacterium]
MSGPAGVGMMQAGETLSKALNRLGFYTLMYPEYPSRIRGGDNNVLVVFSEEKYLAPVEKVDLLLAFGKENFQKHESEGREGFKGFEGEEIGLNKIAEELGNPLVANTAGLGFIFKVLGLRLEFLEEQIQEEFKDKKQIKKLNLEAARRGYKVGVRSEKWEVGSWMRKREARTGDKIANYSGNEALVEGILKADCGFAAIYPMTPINSILTMLARSKVRVFRPEDEIAGIMSAIGASYAGKRALVATSGGGFSLMVEGVGMAGMAEIPIVIIVGQRTGPSTGMATFSSQADLNFVINAGQGEFPRIVLAPGDIAECRRLGEEAFWLAEKYQVPVILLTDKYLAESRFSADEEEIKLPGNEYKIYKNYKNYKRYQLTDSGISPRALPGQVAFLTNSYEHDEEGFSCDEAENRRKMMKKRMGKL